MILNGFLNDVLMVSLMFPVLLIPVLLYRKDRRWSHWMINGTVVLLTGFFTWSTICEWFFWDEFSTRLNFIAVDYLIYTKEVVGNIRESFSLPTIATIFLIVAGALSYFAIKLINSLKEPTPTDLRIPVTAVLAVSVFSFLNPQPHLVPSTNLVIEDLSKNGVYEFFSAFRNNEINFKKMYATTTEEKMLKLMKEEFSSPGSEPRLVSESKLYKHVTAAPSPKKLNLVFIAVESLGAKFIGPLGNKENLTPHLNKLADESIFFTNLYATGTRTVRGLEALSLSLPPTPGASIVRRPKNQNLMSIGRIFQKMNYETKFIYGGHGIFDNMNKFFENNNYEIVDRTDFESKEITFSNVWGVADEDLFNKVLRESDESFQSGKNFFSMVLTTSNHRPFTYPDGRIDIPSHTSRAGAVKYTDYAIGQFLEKAKSKPWFKDTVFVVVADHSTEGRGVIDVPVETYHIPLFIYSPGNLKPQKVETVASQIDVIPTVLELMGIHQNNVFFGKNIMTMKKSDERFFVGTYQKVGMYRNNHFVSLGPKKTVECYDYNPQTKILTQTTAPCLKELVELTKANYQYASYLYKKGLYNDKF